MRRLNLKLLLGLVLGVVSLAAGVHVVHGLQSTRSANALIHQADLAEKKGNRAKAARYLERYLSYAPGDVEAQARFGKLLLPDDPRSAPADARVAVSAFEKALGRDPGRDDLRRQVVGVLMKLGQRDAKKEDQRVDYAAALTHLDVLTASAPHDAELNALRGECLEALGRDEEAARAYDQARRDDTHRVGAYDRLAAVLRRLGRRKEADRVIDAVDVKDGVIAANGRSGEAYGVRARYRRKFHLKGSGEDAARALELAPDDAEVILTAFEVALDKGKAGHDEARALLERGAKAHPKDLRMYRALAMVESISGRPAGVIDAYERGLKAFPDNVGVLWYLADAQISGGKLSAAGGSVKRLREAEGVQPAAVRYLEARLLIARGKWSEAAATLERAAPELEALPALAEQAEQAALAKKAYLLLGRCYAALGDADRQFATYRHAASISLPGAAYDMDARLGMAAALAARNKIDEAVAEYRRILTLPAAPPEVRLALARLSVVRNLRLPASQRQWAEAERALDEAERALPGSPEVAGLRAEIFLAKGKPDEAARVIRAAREKSPDRVNLWVAEADLAFRAGKADEALRLIDEAEKRLGRRVELRQARASFWARRGGPEAVAALDAIEASAAALGGDERRQLLDSLADAYTRAGEPARARRIIRRRADEEPNNLPLRLALFEQAQLDGDEAAADRLLADIRRLDTEKSQALFAEASLLIRRASKDKGVSLEPARRLLSEAARRRPNWTLVPLAEARIDEIQGRPESALGNYLRAIEQGDQNPSAVLRAAQLLFERGRYDQASQVLQKLQSQTAMTGDQQRMAVELAWRSRDYDRALAQARAAVASDPNDFRNSLYLGRILYYMATQDEADGGKSAARKDEAERALRRSVELAKGDPAPRVALVLFLAATGRKADALAMTREAEKGVKAGRDRLALAQCYETLGDAAKVSESYRKALEEAPEDPAVLQAVALFDLRNGRSKGAEASLRKLAALTDEAPRDASWARRTLARVVAAGGDPKRVAEALSILDTGDGGGPKGAQKVASVDDRRTRVEVLAGQPDQADQARRREAIGILTGLVKEGAATADDRLRLAQLYEADGDWPRARETFQALMASDGMNPQYVAPYALILIDRKAFKDAETWAARIEQILPGSSAATGVRARLLHAQGRKAQAVALVKAYVKGKDAETFLFARLLDTLGEYDAAESLYRKAAERPGRPDERLALINFLGLRGRTREALEMSDAAWADLPPARVASLSVKILSEAKDADDAAFQRLAARLEQAARANPSVPTLRFDLANLRTYQGKCDAAEAIYREYFERNPASAAPLNNIAWLLAVQDGKGAEALATVERAIKMEGELPPLLDTRALAYLALERPADALQDLGRVVALKPTADMYFHLARAYQMAGKRGEAGEALRKAKGLGLSPAKVHPLERPAYERLVAALAKP